MSHHRALMLAASAALYPLILAGFELLERPGLGIGHFYYFPVAMVVSIASGVLAAVREMRSLWPVTVCLVAGLGAVASDLVANQELVGFHLAVTFTICALAWSAWSITSRLIRADRRG